MRVRGMSMVKDSPRVRSDCDPSWRFTNVVKESVKVVEPSNDIVSWWLWCNSRDIWTISGGMDSIVQISCTVCILDNLTISFICVFGLYVLRDEAGPKGPKDVDPRFSNGVLFVIFLARARKLFKAVCLWSSTSMLLNLEVGFPYKNGPVSMYLAI